jgi:hypothetical protein
MDKRTNQRRPQRFLDWEIDPDNYDDERALAAYVWRHYRHLMTPLARRIGDYSVPIVSDSPIDKARRVHAYLEQQDGHVSDSEVHEAFKMDRNEFKMQVMRRLMSQRIAEMILNRCPKCSRLTRSPAARLCPWCGHHWHEADS